MSKHTNNLSPSSHARCKCGRYATIGEAKARIGLTGCYTCPDCSHHDFQKRYGKLKSSADYYRSFGINTSCLPVNNIQ